MLEFRAFSIYNQTSGTRVKLTNLFILSRAVSGFGLLLTLLACSDQMPSTATALSQEEQRVQTGSQTARMCVGCHGPKGISRVASYPSIAGRPQAYLAEQLRAFRDGTRENPMMSSIAKSMDDEDILALSYYFASLPAPVAANEQATEQVHD